MERGGFQLCLIFGRFVKRMGGIWCECIQIPEENQGLLIFSNKRVEVPESVLMEALSVFQGDLLSFVHQQLKSAIWNDAFDFGAIEHPVRDRNLNAFQAKLFCIIL